MLTLLLIFLLVSNALTTRRDKSILFSRIVTMGLLMISFLAYNNLHLNPLGEGIAIYGGLFNVTTFTYALTMCIPFASAVILTLTAFYSKNIKIYTLLSTLTSTGIGLAIKYPLIFFSRETGFTLLAIPFAVYTALLVGNIVNMFRKKELLKLREMVPIVGISVAFSIAALFLQELKPLCTIIELAGGILPGFALAIMEGPSGAGVSKTVPLPIVNTLNSNLGGSVPTGSGSGSGTSTGGSSSNTGSANNTGAGAVQPNNLQVILEARRARDNLSRKGISLCNTIENIRSRLASEGKTYSDKLGEKQGKLVELADLYYAEKDKITKAGGGNNGPTGDWLITAFKIKKERKDAKDDWEELITPTDES